MDTILNQFHPPTCPKNLFLTTFFVFHVVTLHNVVQSELHKQLFSTILLQATLRNLPKFDPFGRELRIRGDPAQWHCAFILCYFGVASRTI